MGGVIHHVLAGLLAVIIVHLIHFNWRYSAAIFIGSLLPDIKFAIVAVKQLTFNIFAIEYDGFYRFWENATHTQYTNWFVLGFVVFAVAAYLYHHHIIKKKTMEEYDLLYVFLLIGIIIHLLIDAFVVESGPWF